MTTVIHINQADSKDVYIGRGSIWGNPYRMADGFTRKECIDKYRIYLPTQPQLMAQLESLRGKRLACHCKPLACHGDVLVALLENVTLE
jgi:hypothetical protein